MSIIRENVGCSLDSLFHSFISACQVVFKVFMRTFEKPERESCTALSPPPPIPSVQLGLSRKAEAVGLYFHSGSFELYGV